MSHPPITADELLDSLMRAALAPTITSSSWVDGNPVLQAGPSPLASMVGGLVHEMSKLDSPVRAKLVEAIAARSDEVAKAAVGRLPEALVYRKQVSSYPSEYRMVIDEWLQAALHEALVDALRPLIAQHLTDRFPTLDLADMKITVNVEVVKP